MGQGQRSCFGMGLKFIAFIMAVGLIISMPFALAGRSFGRVLFRPGILGGVLRESILGSGAIEDILRSKLLTDEIFTSISGEDEILGRYFEYLSPGEREEIFLALLPPNWVEEQFSTGIREISAWLDDDRPVPKLALDITPLKAKLLGGGITTFVDIVVDSWPSCKPEQVEALQRAFFEGGQLPEDICEPPEPMRSRVVDLASIGFEEQVRILPEKVPLLETDESPQDFLALKEQLRFFRAISLWGWMLPLSLLGLIMALVIRTWKDVGRWWGIPFILGGVGALFVALLLSAARAEVVSSWSANMTASAALQGVFSAGLNALYRAGLRPLWLQGIFVVMIGLVLWLISRRGGKARSMAAPAVIEPATVARPIVETDASAHEPEEEEGEPPEGIFG
jgi:hypothetical protein